MSTRIEILLAALLMAALQPGTSVLAAEPSVTFAAAGDIAAHSNWRVLINSLNQSDADFFLALGDLSYRQDPQGLRNWCNTWLTGEENNGVSFKNIRLVAGNHDTGEDEWGDINLYATYCSFGTPTSFVSAPNKITNNNQTRGCTWPDQTRKCYAKEYYSDVPEKDPLVRIIVASPSIIWRTEGQDNAMQWRYDNCRSRFTHCGWVMEAIDNATSAGIRWVVVAVHKPKIEVSRFHEGEIAQEFFDRLIEKNVIILHAHIHSYQRSKQLALSRNCPNVVSEFDPDCVVKSGNQFLSNRGSIVATVGTGGQTLGHIKPETDLPYFETVDNSTHGYLKIKASKSQLTGTFVKTAGTGTLNDMFTVTYGEESIFGSPFLLFGTVGLISAAVASVIVFLNRSAIRRILRRGHVS